MVEIAILPELLVIRFFRGFDLPEHPEQCEIKDYLECPADDEQPAPLRYSQ